jgi:phenylalanine-4-hydroxylase
LDVLGNTPLIMLDGHNQDHPSYTDPEYTERRHSIGRNGKGYQMGTPIPGLEYTQSENDLWGLIWDNLHPKLMAQGCKEYKENFQKLVDEGLFNREQIPQLEDLNQFLNKKSNWRIKPVNGILSQREFLNCLAFRTFCSTQFIRHPSRPDYTPEPDILHEFMGHIPMFADKKVCDISQLIGQLSLGATDEQIVQLGAIYWFTIEFGMCFEDGKRKFFGAGIAGSIKELANLESCPELRELDILNYPVPTDLCFQDIQPYFYCAKSFSHVLDQLETFSQEFDRPFGLTYNVKENSYELDREINMGEMPNQPTGICF